MTRVTEKQLDNIIERLNVATNNPTTYGVREDNSFKCNIGHYKLSAAYGGYQLQQIMNEGGGANVVSRNGYTTKRDLFCQIEMLLNGVEINKLTGDYARVK